MVKNFPFPAAGRIVFLFVVTLLAGCVGYTLGPVQPTYMRGIHKVAVPVFKNATIAPDVEALATSVVIKQIQQDGTYEIVGVDRADAIVEGTIASVHRTKARALLGNVLASAEFNLVVEINFRIVRPNSQELLNQRAFTGQSSFFVGNDIAAQERQAIPLAVEDAAIQFVSFLSEGW
jgi:lipopolysaccharide assembly LptE-like protein